MYLIPILLVITFVIAIVKKVSLFESFSDGVRDAIKLSINLLPYLVSVFFVIELMRASGVASLIAMVMQYPLSVVGIPSEIAELIILRPLSGSGSLAMLEEIIKEYGVDSYPARVSAVIMGSTDTVLYVTAVYFSTSKNKKTGIAIPVSISVSLLSTILASWLCRIM